MNRVNANKGANRKNANCRARSQQAVDLFISSLPSNQSAKNIKVTLVRSLIARLDSHIKSVHALGLRKIRQSVVVKDTPNHRGMINKARYLLNVEEVN